jgi:hypothetical protein
VVLLFLLKSAVPLLRHRAALKKSLKAKGQSIGALFGAVSSFPSSFDLHTKPLLGDESGLLGRLLGLRDVRFVRSYLKKEIMS